MAIAHVQSTSGNGSGTSLAVAFGSNNTAGNLLVYGSGGDSDTTNITDTNNTPVSAIGANDDPNFTYADIYYVQNCAAGANTATRTNASGQISLSVAEYSGVKTSGALDQVNTGAGSGTAAASASVTTTQADELLIGLTVAGASVTFTPGASYTERTDTGGLRSSELEDQIVASIGSYTASSTLSGSNPWLCLIATFKATVAVFDQEGYRWRDDDGSEAAATWLASQDTDVTRAFNLNTRLRVIVNTTNDADATTYSLEVLRPLPGGWATVVAAVGEIRLATSANIAAGGGTATTAQLTAPAGKTSGADFQAGLISDDTNPLPSLNLASGKYTELEWCLQAISTVAIEGTYQFRVTRNGAAFDTYTVTPQWTLPEVTASLAWIQA